MADSLRWTADQMPDASGRTFVVTGGNSGLGFEATRAIARRGGRVVIACRDLSKAREAIDAITSERPYRHALSFETAVQQLTQASGVQFDPNIIDIFLTAGRGFWESEREKIDQKVKENPDFS